jgi:L-seryl-tRNA(Ser) seleniumtransferase
VVNATGVVLHTNLGRAPLAQVALDAMVAAASGASNLEYDIATGARGSRYDHAVPLLCELTGAEDALVVNNCAAALVLVLNTFAEGKDAVISRGELIEIGGSFRVPDIMAKSGAILREVGTTNRTHPDDYRRAASPTTGTIVKVHRSNFEQRGFVAEASLRDLAPIAADVGVPLLHDFGSGLLVDLSPWGLSGEATASEALAHGATLLVMSADKLLGGPQAGVLLGSSELIARCRRNPLTRTFRVDKLTLASLEATLALYRDPAVAVDQVPVLNMLTASPERIGERARLICEGLRAAGHDASVVPTLATVGGGAFPMAQIPSFAVALAGDAAALESRIRTARTPVIGRVSEGTVLLDPRSVWPAAPGTLLRPLLEALS